jgi:DHA2 family multidrug resistance protein
MPVAGKMVSRVNPKWVLFVGLLVAAYSTWILTGISLSTDFDLVAWARIVMGVGLAFIFVSLTNLTLSGVPKEEMGNATSIYNLLRNLGGSFGVAFITTVVAQRAQFHQARYVEEASLLNPNFQYALAKVSALPQVQASGNPLAAKGFLFQQAVMQASLFSFVDAFFLCTALLCLITPLIFFLRRPAHMKEPIAVH